MGMVINGRWVEEDQQHQDGRYVRPMSVFKDSLSDDLAQVCLNQPGRLVLIGSSSCPWSHRCMLVRAALGLEDVIPVHLAHGKRVEGYAADDGRPWRIPGSNKDILHIHQLYSHSHADYTGRSTVPILWDSTSQKILSNESFRIVQFMSCLRRAEQPDLFPDSIEEAHAPLRADIHEKFNNGVYRAGFAKTQAAYNEAVEDVFTMMDSLERRLTESRYLMGDSMVFADLQLFPTLVRFDSVYHILHRCTRKRLSNYPNLWAFTREINALPGIAKTVNFDAILQASYANDTENNAEKIIPELPELDWSYRGERDQYQRKAG